jgi:glycosyltransferase involved in cell wall biosynthesis
MRCTLKLSIVVPTYNRANSLGLLLDSILFQLEGDDDIEIIISDNKSTDHTREVVEDYQDKYPMIRYHCNEKNKGIDYNIYRAVKLAKAEYVYMISDDDVLLPEGLRLLFSLIRDYPKSDFFYINGRGFSRRSGLTTYYSDPVISNVKTIEFSNKYDFLELLGPQITFISAFLFRRSAWDRNLKGQSYIGTDIYLSYELIHLLAQAENFVYMGKPIVGVHDHYTPGNYRVFYAFAYQWRRLLLVEAVSAGYDKKNMKKIFRKSIKHLKVRIVKARKYKDGVKIDARTFLLLFRSLYDTSFYWTKILPTLLRPRFSLKKY